MLGIVLTHDDKMLLGVSGKSVLFIDAATGETLRKLDEAAVDGKVYINITRDDKLAFVANERSHSISIIDVAQRKAIQRIQVGNAPIALTFSPDEKWLYSTSQSATPD